MAPTRPTFPKMTSNGWIRTDCDYTSVQCIARYMYACMYIHVCYALLAFDLISSELVLPNATHFTTFMHPPRRSETCIRRGDCTRSTSEALIKKLPWRSCCSRRPRGSSPQRPAREAVRLALLRSTELISLMPLSVVNRRQISPRAARTTAAVG